MDMLTSAFFALPFFAFTLIQVLRKQSGHGWLDRLLGFAALLVPTSAIYLALLSGTLTPNGESALLVVGIIGIVLGLIFLLLERKRTGYRFARSRGLLSAGIGALLIMALVTTPLITTLMLGGGVLPSEAFAETALASPAEDDMEASAEVFAQVPMSPTPSPTPQATVTLMPTATFTPYPSATPMPPLPTLALPTSTPGAMPALATPNAVDNPTMTDGSAVMCQVTTGANLNLRQSPTTDASILITIPNGTRLNASETTTDRSWWRVSYDGQVGWIIRDYLFLDGEC
jgi:hypothetical protein